MAISPAEFMQVQLANSQKKFGMSCYRADQHYIQQFGAPLPSLSLQYMFGVENLPFGRFYGFRGKTESFKSSMVFYLMKVIMENAGLGILVETENKLSDTLQEGIIQDERDMMEICRPGTLEDAQSMITNGIAFIKKELPGRHIPYALGWDSLRGVLSGATSDKISKDGHYAKGYSSEAHMLSPYFAKLVEELACWPISMFFVQHEKIKMAAPGSNAPPSTSVLGGEAPGFHATVLTRSKVIKAVVEGALNPYATIEYRTVKNNLGVKGRRCVVSLFFHQVHNEETGVNEHRYYFDWDTADCACILGDKMENKEAIKKVMDLEEHSTNKGYFRSTTLGVTKATATEIMDMLRSDEHKDLYDELRRAMRITKNLRFDQVEWKQVGGTKANPLMGWAVKEGVDLTGIHAPLAKEEDEEPEEKPKDAGAKKK